MIGLVCFLDNLYMLCLAEEFVVQMFSQSGQNNVTVSEVWIHEFTGFSSLKSAKYKVAKLSISTIAFPINLEAHLESFILFYIDHLA